jgi:superfamily II DNA or RNA helicase
MTAALKPFQQEVCAGIVARWQLVKARYDALPAAEDETERDKVRRTDAALVLQAPTGSGKTLLAIEAIAAMARVERVLWFWFAPFAGLIEQARGALVAQAPQLALLDLATDRRLDAVARGGVFVTTWQSVAANKKEGRKARVKSDAGLALDALLAQARADGVRIGCVVDEAHHGFHRDTEARRFFVDVLRPDYTLMMTATPRDADARAFERDTGYGIGEPDDWASVAREAAVDAGLLKRGVKLVRFVARNNDEAALIDYEHTALRACTEMHRRLASTLREAGVGLIPLMLVQVPNGEEAQKVARKYLIDELGFPESAVRLHTAKEPDPDLIALARDPAVEVLVFKMAVALGFDAPRAFTLAALRGTREPDFGVQVIGRIVRVHPSMQGRTGLAPELDYGYVFLANSEAQEGLLEAGKQINELETHAPELGTQTVVTVMGGDKRVQVLKTGQSGALWLDGGATPAPPAEPTSALGAFDADAARNLTGDLFVDSPSPTAASAAASAVATVLASDAATVVTYRRRPEVPSSLLSEWLPPPGGTLEEQVVAYVDFNREVLGSMHQTLARVLRVETDVFAAVKEDAETYELAKLSAERIGSKVERELDMFREIDRRKMLALLASRFREKLMEAGFPPPPDADALDDALDLVLARHPALLREANKRARMPQVEERRVDLPPAITHPAALPTSRRNAYGVLPPGLNADERAIARMLDEDDKVLWWHRNPPRRPESVALYRWNDGAAFYPDFIVAYADRPTTDHIALLEPKGPLLWGLPTEVAKALGPAHAQYGRCVFVGKRKGKPFELLRPIDRRLEPDGAFDVARLRFVDR